MASQGAAWLEEFRLMCPVDSLQFADTWNKFDSDGNGFIDGDEIDSFFNTLLVMGMKGKSLSPAEKQRLKDDFMREFDENRDGRIEMAELAKLLHPEDNFLIIFRSDNKGLSGKDFMVTWRKLAGRRDYIESGEVKNFLQALFRCMGQEVAPSKLDEYSKTIISIYDSNNDGKLSFQELSRLLPEQENVLLRFKDKLKLTTETFDAMFNHYDADGNGSISGEELEVFLRDVALSISDDIVKNPGEFHRFKSMMLTTCDESGDGILQKDEIKLWLGVE